MTAGPAITLQDPASLAPLAPVPTARPHLPHLDALRAAAVLMVMGFHLYGESYKWGFLPPNTIVTDLHAHATPLRWIAAPLTLGYAGVPLFFVLSGFCIHYAFLRSRQPFSYGRFMWRRAWRIYPAYLAAIAFALLISPVPLLGVHHLRKSLLLHLAMLHNFTNHEIYEWNPSFWTLPIEFQFYAGYPLFLWIRRRVGIHRAAAAAMLLSLALVAITWARNLNQPAILAFPLLSWGQWCLGALIAERFVDGRGVLLKLPPVLILCLPLIALTSDIIYWQWAALLWAVVFASLIDVWIRRPADWLPRSVLWIGTISYSIYLLHQPTILRLLWYLPPATRASADARFLRMLLWAPPLVLALAAASFYLLELPGMWIGHRQLPRRR